MDYGGRLESPSRFQTGSGVAWSLFGKRYDTSSTRLLHFLERGRDDAVLVTVVFDLLREADCVR